MKNIIYKKQECCYINVYSTCYFYLLNILYK
nr:MAG TPA: hypothetical protein [Caudoviricetes sp.]